MKLWSKADPGLPEVNDFTSATDKELDLLLAPFDVLGSLAHVKMLTSVGLIAVEDGIALSVALKAIYKRVEEGTFQIEPGVEDVHSQVEWLLTRQLGETGKKIHSARSRNDQVLLDVKLFMRHEIERLAGSIEALFTVLIEKSEQHKEDLLPGYTHLQLAMPSSFGLWFGAFAEGLSDDLIALEAAYRIVNKNPLGSAAGYGSSFPIDRKLTTTLLGFDDLNYNVVYAQMGRGKAERIVVSAMANVSATLARFCMDVTLFLNQNFGFISFPDNLTTGSSIMPHKKNPDVFELIRARCNRMMALPNEMAMITVNLPTGYHRDLQLLKEHLFPAFNDLDQCIRMATFMIEKISVTKDILQDERYAMLFSVEEVNKRVIQGTPFREAYRQIAEEIADGRYTYSGVLHHTHEGSLGNLCNTEIVAAMNTALAKFNFKKTRDAYEKLLA